jgi:hypothetical protein
MAHGGLFGRQLRIVGLGPLLGDVVEHADFIEDQLQLTDELGMSGVWQIDIKTCFVSKGYEEAMGEAIVEVLRADVGAPFKTFDGVDLLGELDEGFLKALHLLSGGAVFELEEYDVAVRSISSG